MTSPSVQSDVRKIPQFTEEVTEGTLPLSKGGTAKVIFRPCGLVSGIGKEFTIESNKINPLGQFDVTNIVKKGENYSTSISFEPFDFNMMYYGGLVLPVATSTVPPDPAMATPNRSPAVSISILLSALMNGTELYRIYTGVRFEGVSGEISKDGGFTVTMPIRARNISEWIPEPAWTLGAGSAGATYATLPSSEPWSGITSGANPLTVNGVNTSTNSFSFDIGTPLAEWDPNGLTTIEYLKMVRREMTINFTTLMLGNTIETLQRAGTSFTVAYRIATNKILTFTGCKSEGQSDNIDSGSNDFMTYGYTMTPTGLTVTDA